MVLGRELGTRQEPEVRGLGLLARDTVARRPQRVVRRSAVGPGETGQRSQDGLQMRLNMAQVVFEGERAVAEYAEERISPATLSRLSHTDVFCQLCDEVGVRVVDDELALGLATDEAVGEDDLALGDVSLAAVWRFGAHDLLAVHLNTKKTR